MASFNRTALITLLDITIIVNCLIAQNLSSEKQKRTQQLTQDSEEAIKQNNYTSAGSHSGKLGYINRNNGFYNEAVKNFNLALKYNSKVGNRHGIKTIRYNLCLINSEQEQYQQTINQFNNGIEIARSLNKKEGILNRPTNKSIALKGSRKHKNSIKAAEKALDIAKELMNSLKFSHRYYGLLTENTEINFILQGGLKEQCRLNSTCRKRGKNS